MHRNVTILRVLPALTVIFTAFVFLPPIVNAQAVTFSIVKDSPVDMIFLKSSDLDLDGEIDLVFSPWGVASSSTQIAYGLGDGAFENPVDILPTFQAFIAVDFVNTDSLPDIVAFGGGNVYVMINQGDRNFAVSSFAQGGTDFNFISAGFINDDAYLDLVTSPANVFLGDGAGNFAPGSSLPIDTAYGADISDFNRDGYDDIVAVSDDHAWILLNDGDGNFNASDSFSLGQLSVAVSTNNSMADFNNDGNPDFAMMVPLIGDLCGNGDHITEGVIALGDGNGGFLDTLKFEICGTTYNLVTSDVNQDGELDIVAANGSLRGLEVLLGNGDGTLRPAEFSSLNTIKPTFVLTSADLNKDGNPDFISGGGVADQDSIISAISDLAPQSIINQELLLAGYSSVDLEVNNPVGHKISRYKNTVAGSQYSRLDRNADGKLDVQTIDYNLQYGDYSFIFKKKPNITSPAAFDANARIGDSKLLRLFRNYETPGTTKGSAVNDSIVFRLTIEQFPTIRPTSGETEFDDMPGFIWSGAVLTKFASNDTYDFQLDDQLEFSSPLIDQTGLPKPSFSSDISLTRNTIYYWHYRTFNGTSYSPWSNEFAVYIGPFFCGDVNNDGTYANILDLVYLVDHIFRGGPPAPILSNADLNGDGTSGNVLDLTIIVDYKFRFKPKPLCGI